MADRERHTGRNVALVGGAVLVGWLLWRKAKGVSGLVGPAADATVTSTTNAPKTPCRVWVRADRIEVDGERADLATVIARCRESGRATVRATGAAITRSIIDVLAALQAAGVVVDAPPDLAHLAAPRLSR